MILKSGAGILKENVEIGNFIVPNDYLVIKVVKLLYVSEIIQQLLSPQFFPERLLFKACKLSTVFNKRLEM